MRGSVPVGRRSPRALGLTSQPKSNLGETAMKNLSFVASATILVALVTLSFCLDKAVAKEGFKDEGIRSEGDLPVSKQHDGANKCDPGTRNRAQLSRSLP